MHEKVSRMLADFLGSTPNFPLMSFAICPVVMMAMVLLAVQRFDRLTSPAMLNSAPLLPRIPPVSPEMMKSSPPFSRMISSIPPASIVTMIRSPIPAIPLPVDSRKDIHVRSPLQNPITAFMTMPMKSIARTFTPESARMIMERYGISFMTLISPISGDESTPKPMKT